MATPLPNLSPAESVRRVAHARGVLRQEFCRAVVGQDELLEQLLIAVFAKGHCLLEGGPGTGKSRTVRALARLLHLEFSHIHGHPDLTLADVVGCQQPRIDPLSREPIARFQRGPLFANLVLIDEVNRIPSQTQVGLAHPLCENQIIAAGERFELPNPFLIVATRNIDERQRIFPLSDALADRFLFSLRGTLPTREEERQIAALSDESLSSVRQVMRPRDILWAQQLATQVVATRHVVDYVVDLVRSTRPEDPDAPPVTRQCLTRGANPHSAQAILRAAKSRAMLHGRGVVHAADVRAMLPAVLRHRVRWRREAWQQGMRIEHLIAELLAAVPENTYDELPLEPPTLEILDQGDHLPRSVDT